MTVKWKLERGAGCPISEAREVKRFVSADQRADTFQELEIFPREDVGRERKKGHVAKRKVYWKYDTILGAEG